MSYESTAEPIKVGYLMDFTLPPGFPEEMKADFTQTFEIVFDEAVQQGVLPALSGVQRDFDPIDPRTMIPGDTPDLEPGAVDLVAFQRIGNE